MPGALDPALLQFAGQLIEGGQKGQIGFGSALGGALQGAGRTRQFQIDQERQNQADMMARAQATVNMRAALGELQSEEEKRAANQAFIDSLPPEQRAAAGVDPGAAAGAAIEAANPPAITPFQQEQLAIAQQEADARIGQIQQKVALAGRPDPKDIAGLRKEFSSLSKPYIDVRDGYKRVLSAKPDAAGDLSLIFSFMKMLDPTSVVRESEQATARNARGVPEAVRATYNRLLKGESLGPDQREEFLSQATQLYQEQYETQIQQSEGFRAISTRMAMDPRDILQGIPMPAPAELVNEAITSAAQRLGTTRATVDQAAQEAGVSPADIIRALEARGGNSP